MRKMSWVVVLLVVLSAPAAQANASFANRSLAYSASAIRLLADTEPIDWAFVPLGLEGGLYIDNGFDTFVRLWLVLAQQRLGVGPTGGPGVVLGGGGQVGVRYLFMEENIRPYADIHLGAIFFDRDSAIGPKLLFGLGPGAGVDVFVADSISIGGRAWVDLYVMLNTALRLSIGFGLNATTYF